MSEEILSLKFGEETLKLMHEAVEKFKDKISKWISDAEACLEKHKEFLQKYPFHTKRDLIDALSADDLYNPGKGDYSFYYVEHGLKCMGKIAVGSNKPWRAAVENLELFKGILKTIVDDSIPLCEKIDNKYIEQLRFWGGDRLIVKKIISLYYPEEVIPIFKTEHLEKAVRKLELSDLASAYASKKYGKSLSDLTPGEKFEAYNTVLLKLKENVEETRGWNNIVYMKFLYEALQLKEGEEEEAIAPEPVQLRPLLFAPQNELEVMLVFARYHDELGFPYILKCSSRFPDAVVIDANKNPKTVEFELRASSFQDHGHDPEKVDYIVCWENDLPENDPLNEKVIELKKLLLGSSPSS